MALELHSYTESPSGMANYQQKPLKVGDELFHRRIFGGRLPGLWVSMVRYKVIDRYTFERTTITNNIGQRAQREPHVEILQGSGCDALRVNAGVFNSRHGLIRSY